MTVVPTATYRLQFNRNFTFRDATELVPYLHALGISHVYASPFLKARAGSTHGYDIIDYGAFNPEIGEEADLDALVAALHDHGMGLIVDFVPNHMGIGTDNAWWLDVLEWGEASPYATFFDIDWQPAKPDLRGKVLLPALGDYYGSVLERGELVLRFDDAAGAFSVWYHEHRFPVSPRLYATLLAPGAERLGANTGAAELVARFRRLRGARAAVREAGNGLKAELARLIAAEPQLRPALIDGTLARLNGTPGEPRSFHLLHWLLQHQAYRLSYWKVAADEINYRRFFDINDLAGVRVEVPRLFDAAHRLILRLYAEGKIDGLRIDHIDGLFEPRAYCRRLNEEAIARRGAPPYLIVEKILARHETLREGWPIAGTTGYETLNLINGLFVRPESQSALERTYRRFTGERESFDEILYASKRYVLEHMMASELAVLANQLDRISEANWRTRDFTLAGQISALKEIAACFPVYRTYITARRLEPEDRRDIDWAVAQAKRRAPRIDSVLFDFVHAALTTDLVRNRREGLNRSAVIRFAMRFQQLTGPVMAKALEDTAFYRYVPFASLNEVGGDPRRFGVSVAAFHHLNQERARRWPHALVATATHDTKRGEDARARLDAISELPEEWVRRARRWAALNRRAKTEVDGVSTPSANDEYLLYQTLVGAWPTEFLRDGADPKTLADFAARISAYAIKAAREAKQHTSWAAPDPAYEEALTRFIERILDPQRGAAFLAEASGFAREIATHGMRNALAQTVLKLTMPGVPDIYQGCELWDLSLVDPDNRRSVDYARRAAALRGLCRATPQSLLETWEDGHIKLHVLARLAALRRAQPGLFRDGTYLPLPAGGAHAERICAFGRLANGTACLVAVPLGPTWDHTSIALPEELARYAWSDVLTGESYDPTESFEVTRLFTTLPVAALATRPPPS